MRDQRFCPAAAHLALIATIHMISPAATAAQTALPTVHVIATGGTISNTGAARRTGEQLISGIPGLDRYAIVTVEQFSNVASGSITPAHMKAISNRVNEVFRTRPDVKGIVVTHGTDTLEETAYFLDLTTGSCNPVVVTGAMRQATAVGADGPANLLNSVRVAASAAAASRGTLVLLNDEVFTARTVSKVNTVRTNAFEAAVEGVAGVVDPDGIVFYHKAERSECTRPLFDVATVTNFPRVDIAYVYAGADSVMIDAAVAAGARGLVIAGAGAGATTPGQSGAINRARDKGVFVLTSSRTGSGRVSVGRGGAGRGGAGTAVDRGPAYGAGPLNPQKARILLMLGLATGASAESIVAQLRD
jgi:L-asparaginase type II